MTDQVLHWSCLPIHFPLSSLQKHALLGGSLGPITPHFFIHAGTSGMLLPRSLVELTLNTSLKPAQGHL